MMKNKYRFSEYENGVWTLDLLERQERLHVIGELPDQWIADIEHILNTEVAAEATSELDWLINWETADVLILSDNTGWCMMVKCQRKGYKQWFEREYVQAAS